jgi:hypothetical protein
MKLPWRRIGALIIMALLSGGWPAAPAWGMADLDYDGDVDYADWDGFQIAYSGPGIPADPFGAAADFDADGDVDLVDAAFMQASFSGSGVPAPPEPAQDPTAHIEWTLSGPAQVGLGAPLPWKASVRVTGDNQGLALYVFSLELQDSQGQRVSGASYGPTQFTATTFSVSGQTGGVTDPPADGGPGMNFAQPPVTTGVGGSATPPGVLDGAGAGYFLWSGAAEMLSGVGLDSAKTLLLNDLDGDGSKTDELYILNDGWLDTSTLIPGEVYTLILIPQVANVLVSGLNLALPHHGFYAAMAGSMTGSSFTFVVPEPSSLLLMVACAAALRRPHRSRAGRLL